MYGQFFNIDESVFSIAPNPKYLFLSKQHEEALAHLLYGVTRKGGFVCLTGEIGTGKTTVCRCMFEQLPENTDIAFVVNPKFSPMELLASICDELKLSYSTFQPSIKEYVKKLNSYLIEAHAKGRNTVLIIDEAQNLSIDALEHIRALTNLETNEQKLLQIILIGQPELRTLLAQQELEQVNQRFTARFHIGPLSLKETSHYINHRMIVAGAKHKIFTEGNIKKIYMLTKGVPRLINILCDRVLLGAYTIGTAEITSKIIKQSADEVFSKTPTFNSMLPKALAASVFAVLVSGAAVFAYQNNTLKLPTKDTIAAILFKEESVTKKKTVVEKNVIQEIVSQKIASENVVSEKQENTVVENQDLQNPNFEEEKSTNIDLKAELIKEKPANYFSMTEPETSVSKKTPLAIVKELKNDVTEEKVDNSLQLTSYGKAYKQLFRVWGVDYTTDDASPCEHALSNKLLCYQSSGSIKTVISLNRPVLLKSKDERFGSSYIVLVSMEDEYAIVSQNGDYQLVSIAEIEANWGGYFEILWRPLQTGVRYIRPGYKGEVVAALDKKLAVLQGREPSSDNPFEYSPELVDQVRAFQVANNLPSDGVVGPITQIHFNNKTSDTPHLIK